MIVLRQIAGQVAGRSALASLAMLVISLLLAACNGPSGTSGY